MADSDPPNAQTFREEINALFGLRWDTLVEWIVISWLSIWLWMGLHETQSLQWSYGPLTGLDGFLESVSLDSPNWVETVRIWITDPDHSWLANTFVAIAVAASVAAIRSHKLSGLRTVALLSATIACEMNQSFFSIVWILIWAAVPAAIACLIGLIDDLRQSDKFDSYAFYHPPTILTDYLTNVVFLFLLPLVAPFLLAVQLIASFQTKLNYDPVDKLHQKATFLLETSPTQNQRLKEAARVARSASLKLAGNQSKSARRIASRQLYNLERRQKADALSRKRL